MQNDSQKGGAGVWVLVIIVVVVAGIFLFVKNGTKDREMPPPPKNAVLDTAIIAPTETIVIYNASGFSPNTVTIKKGGAVIFQNKTGKPASVASGAHPTHLLYPEFDQYKTEQRGQNEFRFVFEQVGTWKYHDHLNATMTGTVVVTE